MIFRVDKNAAISSVAACNNNKKEKKNNTKKKKKKKKKTRQISTRRCVVGCLQAAVSQDHHIVLCACARAGHMTYTNAHITIHSPYSIAGVRSSTIKKPYRVYYLGGVINREKGLTLLIPLITGDITYLISGMIHQVVGECR